MPTTVVETPTFTAPQGLMDHSGGEGMIVSCYADTSVSGVRSHWREPLAVELRQIEARMAGDQAARRQLVRDVDTIRSVLSGPAAKRAKGMAVFASVARNFIRTFALETPVANRLVADEDVYVVPLLEYLHRQRRFLIVHTDSHHGLLYTAGRGPLRLLEEIAENVPRRHAASGERWGKQQATIARHREDHLLHYRKELVKEVERAFREEPYQGLMLFGEQVVIRRLRDELPSDLGKRVVFEGRHPFAGRTIPLESKVQHATEEAMREHDRRLGQELRERLAEHMALATGPQEVIDAIRGSQVNWPGFLVMGPDHGVAGWRCSGCGSIFDQDADVCPSCQSAGQKVNLWQEIALLATRHSIPVHFVGRDVDLVPYGGVVAMLTREHPWEPAAMQPSAT